MTRLYKIFNRTHHVKRLITVTSFTISLMIQGYHVYREVWHAEVDDELQCEREVGNHSDTFAVAVKKVTATVPHNKNLERLC